MAGVSVTMAAAVTIAMTAAVSALGECRLYETDSSSSDGLAGKSSPTKSAKKPSWWSTCSCQGSSASRSPMGTTTSRVMTMMIRAMDTVGTTKS